MNDYDECKSRTLELVYQGKYAPFTPPVLAAVWIRLEAFDSEEMKPEIDLKVDFCVAFCKLF